MTVFMHFARTDNDNRCRLDFLPKDGCLLRHPTIEVHSPYSEAPHLRRSITHPKTDSAKIKLHPKNIPTAQVYENVIFLKQDWYFGDFGLRSPVVQ